MLDLLTSFTSYERRRGQHGRTALLLAREKERLGGTAGAAQGIATIFSSVIAVVGALSLKQEESEESSFIFYSLYLEI
jgi:hypothetical protein